VTSLAKSRSIQIASLALLVALAPLPAGALDPTLAVDGRTFVNQGLVAVGRLPANLRDKFGETFGSSSGMAIDPSSWHRTATGYEGTLVLLPDRGYNAEGTTDYRPRLNTVTVKLTPADPAATLDAAAQQSGVSATLADSLLLTEASGASLTGLDPDSVRGAADGLPDLPQAINGRISLDAEAIARVADGSFFIGDEYGPYIYRFSAAGQLLSAIRPPAAFIPMRSGEENFSSNNPGGPGSQRPSPEDPDSGRQNNQGFEGVALTPDGKLLVAVLQSATRQDGGRSAATRRYTRALVYDVSDPAAPKLTGEYVVPLPVFKDQGKTKVAAQSELLALSDTLFLLLCRDSNNGYGVKGDSSQYRRVELLDLGNATNIVGTDYDGGKPVAPKGELAPDVVPATLQSFIDLNDNAQLSRFGLHQGPPNDRNNLSEKWESMSLIPAMDPQHPQDFFLVIGNDNDFLTQDGFQVGAAYQAAGGADVDTMLLVYRVTLPSLATN
jgi:hypothetical protein